MNKHSKFNRFKVKSGGSAASADNTTKRKIESFGLNQPKRRKK